MRDVLISSLEGVDHQDVYIPSTRPGAGVLATAFYS